MKMTFKQFLPIPIIVAAVATVLVIVYNQVFPEISLLKNTLNPGMMAVTFQAWAMYFMAGCCLLGGLKTLIGYIGGIVASVLIMEMSGLFSQANQSWALPLAVFIVVIPVIMAERVKLINFVPAWFIGSGMFFVLRSGAPFGAMGTRWGAHWDVGLAIVAACLVGQIFGVITVWSRMAYEGMLPKPKEEPVLAAAGVAETPASQPTPIAEPAPAPVVEEAPAEACGEECVCEAPAEACDEGCACEAPAEEPTEKPAE